jgi:hypothetical protein
MVEYDLFALHPNDPIWIEHAAQSRRGVLDGPA